MPRSSWVKTRSGAAARDACDWIRTVTAQPARARAVPHCSVSWYSAMARSRSPRAWSTRACTWPSASSFCRSAAKSGSKPVFAASAAAPPEAGVSMVSR